MSYTPEEMSADLAEVERAEIVPRFVAADPRTMRVVEENYDIQWLNMAAGALAVPESAGLDYLLSRVKSAYYGDMKEAVELASYEVLPATDRWGNDIIAIISYGKKSLKLASYGGRRILGDEAGMTSWKWDVYMD
jgi:hypothetical protein